MKGPPTVPVLGNLREIPRTGAHFKFTEWAKKYGGIFSLKVGKGSMIVLTDRRLIRELVDKRGTLYNSRPRNIVSEIITGGDNMIVEGYTELWRITRKLTHQKFMASACERDHQKIVEAEGRQLMRDFLVYPEEGLMHPKRYGYSISNTITYAIRSKDHHDDYLHRIYHLMERWSELLEPGAVPPIEIFPWMSYIPERFFNNWKTDSVKLGKVMEALFEQLLQDVLARRERGENRGSLVDEVLDQQEKHGLTHHQLAQLGGVLQQAGADTAASVILIGIQALVLHPQIQKKAQAEIDVIVGDDRSPTWEDFGKMQYLNMIIKEVHRWRPIGPTALLHSLTQDDWVDGMCLPKDSTIVLNVWGIHMDPDVYENPTAFIPERFAEFPLLASDYSAGDWEKRDHYGYGAGRRICPGIHLAERKLFIAFAKLLWAFDIEHEVDSDGKEVPIDVDPVTGYEDGFIRSPKGFRFRATPRSEKRKETIMREFEDVEEVFSKFT